MGLVTARDIHASTIIVMPPILSHDCTFPDLSTLSYQDFPFEIASNFRVDAY